MRERENKDGNHSRRLAASQTSAGQSPPAGWWAATDRSGKSIWHEDTRQESAGWGVVIFRYPTQDTEPDYVLHSPVVTETWDQLWLGARERTNNTGELSAIGELMLWLLHEAPDEGNVPMVVRYDSTYAANMAQGIWGA